MPSFLWLSNILLCIYTTASSSIHLVNGHLGCLHVLAIVNSAAMNNGIHVSLSVLVSSRYMPRSGIAGSCGGFIPSFLIFIYFFFLSPFCFPVGYICFTAKDLICFWMSCLRYLTNDSNNFLLRQLPVFQAWYCIIDRGLENSWKLFRNQRQKSIQAVSLLPGTKFFLALILLSDNWQTSPHF